LVHVAVCGVGIDNRQKFDVFTLTGVHSIDFFALVEFQFLDALEAFLEVGLHPRGVLSLRENFKQLVVREEVESREGGPLALEVVVQTALDSVERVLAFLQSLQKGPILGEVDDLRILHDFRHHRLPVSIHIPEIGCLDGEMLLDIRRGENRLEIEPHGLHLDPILRKIKRIEQPLLPIPYLRLEDLSVGTALHRLRLDDLVVQDLLHLVYRCTGNDESASIAPFLELDIDRRPIVLHLTDDLFNTELFLSVLGNDLQLWDFIEDFVDLDQFSYIEVLVGIHGEVRVLAHLRPVPFFHPRVAEHPDKRGELRVVLDLVCEPVEHLERSLESGTFLAFFVAVDRIAGIEPVGQLQRFVVHLLDLLLDELGVQLEDGRLDPRSVIVIECANHAPEVDIGLDLCACGL